MTPTSKNTISHGLLVNRNLWLTLLISQTLEEEVLFSGTNPIGKRTEVLNVIHLYSEHPLIRN